jgi:hypothetical protein
VDGIISFPIAIAGYFLIPDMPENTKAWYLTEEVRTWDSYSFPKGAVITDSPVTRKCCMHSDGWIWKGESLDNRIPRPRSRRSFKAGISGL